MSHPPFSPRSPEHFIFLFELLVSPFIIKQPINPNSVRGSADNECNKNIRANNNSELEQNMLRGLANPRPLRFLRPPLRSQYHCLSADAEIYEKERLNDAIVCII